MTQDRGPAGDRPRGPHGLQHLVAVRVDHVGKTQPAPQPETEVALAGGGGELNGLRPLPEHDLADGRRHGQGLGQLRGGEGARPAVDVNAVGLVGAGAGRHVGETRHARGPERPGHARHVVRDAAVLRRVVRADEQGSHGIGDRRRRAPSRARRRSTSARRDTCCMLRCCRRRTAAWCASGPRWRSRLCARPHLRSDRARRARCRRRYGKKYSDARREGRRRVHRSVVRCRRVGDRGAGRDRRNRTRAKARGEGSTCARSASARTYKSG